MRERLDNIYQLGVKELISLRSDLVLVLLIVYVFTFAVYTISIGASTEVENASVAIVDEDSSPLSRRIQDALLKPYFQEPVRIGIDEIDTAMDAGRYTFVIDIPPAFQADVLAGRKPTIQLSVDATAMSQAGTGANYIQNIISQEILTFISRKESEFNLPVDIVIRAQFNPNLKSSWFLAVMQIINNITLLAIVLTGAALIREREHGTIEHLLVMPLRPVEIMLAKVWANGLVIVIAATFSLYLVVQWLLAIPISGSIPLFVLGTVIYLFSVTALGIFLATVARSMPQFGLLAIPVFIVMEMLSGSTTPLDSMPKLLQYIMQFSPSTHFVTLAQGILYRGAGLEVVWPEFTAVAACGMAFLAGALLRFRKTIAVMQA
jgi:ABC-2 type transport system permease protein